MSSLKKKILIITPRYPIPVIGGDKLRIYNLCKALSQQFELSLISFCETKEEMELIPNDPLFSETYKIFLPKWKSYLRSLIAYATNKPMQLGYYSSRKMRSILIKILPSHDYVLAHLIRTGQYLENINTNCKKILEMTDAISLNYERVKKLKNKKRNFKTFLYSIESSRLKKYEKNILYKFDLVSLVSHIDKDFLTENIDCPNVQVYTNGVDVSKFELIDSSIGCDIIFIGNMRTEQNSDACRYFALDILPKIRSIYPNIRFKIIGMTTEKFVREFSKYEGVDIVGAVDTVCNSAKNAFVAVCPLRLGAGIQNKILEYMALGIPTITTYLGLEGINAKIGSEIIVADTTESFKDAVLEIYNNRELGRQIGLAGRRFVKENHNWENLLNGFVNTINNL